MQAGIAFHRVITHLLKRENTEALWEVLFVLEKKEEIQIMNEISNIRTLVTSAHL